MKVLVAGATGFIGSHIVKALVEDGNLVKALIRENSNPWRIPHGCCEFVYSDIFEPGSIMSYLKDVDVVFSAFGVLGQWGRPGKTYWEVNYQQVKNLLESCLYSDIKQFIHISSAGVLGPLPDGVVADESFPLNPSNVYEQTKCKAEDEILRFNQKHGFPSTIIRPEFVYGPGDTHVLGLFKAIQTKKFVLLGTGQSLLHPTYIDDLIRGISLCIDNESAFGEIFLLTGERSYPVKELAGIIAKELGVDLPKIRIPLSIASVMAKALELGAKVTRFNPPLTVSRVKFFSENRSFSILKAQSDLGYIPKIDFKEGAKRTIHWYRENGYL